MARKPTAADMFNDGPEEEEKVEQPQTPSEDKVPEVTGDAVVTLPSNGSLGYPTTIEYRDLLVKDEEVLSTATPQNYNRTINGVLKSACKSVDFFNQISIHDRDYLLVYLWANNYDPVKRVNIKCEHCGEEDEHQVDLTDLEVTGLREDFKQPLKVPLSQQAEGSHVRVFMSTVEHELVVEEYMQKKGDKNKLSFEHLMAIASIDVGMSIPFERKIEWISENMTAREMGFVRKYHDYFKFGVKDTVEYKCRSCGEVTTGMLPFQIADIFNPSVSDDFAQLLHLD